MELFLYSCLSSSNRTEIRLFELATREDTLIYECESYLDIVNASLNPNRDVVAFTVFQSNMINSQHEANERMKQCDLSKKQNYRGDGNGVCDAGWVIPLTETIFRRNTNGDSVQKSEFSVPTQKGNYKSYLADIYPSRWLEKFNIDRSFYQKVIFTNCCKQKELDGILTIENRLLLVMHRHHIAMYTIYLKSETFGAKNVDSSNTLLQEIVEIYGNPKALSIVGNCYWSQWNYARQQLYYLHVKKGRKKSEELNNSGSTRYSTSLCCEQFAEEQFHQQVFSCPINLDLEECFFVSKDSSYKIDEMESTVSSGLNMKLLHLENGMMCLCCQSTNEDNSTLYKIIVINKDIVMTCVSNTVDCDISSHQLSFSTFGNNILIHSPPMSIHVIAIDALSSDPYNFKQHCHYLANIPELPNVISICQLPYTVPRNINNTEAIGNNNQCYVYDQATKNISVLYIERDSIGHSYFNEGTTLENKLALARFASIAFHEDASRSTLLKNVLLSFLEKNMILQADKILATLLLQTAANDLCHRFCEVNFLRDVLPNAVSMPPVGSEKFSFVFSYVELKDKVCPQISKAMESKYNVDLWKAANHVLKHGSNIEPYDLSSVDEEICILKADSLKPHQQEQKDVLKDRLNTIFEQEFLQAIDTNAETDDENILDCFRSHQQDHMRENLMALTFEKLCDHLKQYMINFSPIDSIARNYITAQLRAVNHYVCLFIYAFAIDEFDRGLFEPLCEEEKNLLQLLNQLLLSCTLINFPIITGLSTFLTCLTFRSCFTTHLYIYDEQDAYLGNSSSDCDDLDAYSHFSPPQSVDIEGFSFEFFQKVDSKCIMLTSEFVARLLEEVPNHDVYGSLITEVLKRTKYDVPMMWKQSHSTSLSAKVQMKKLISAPEQKLRSNSTISGSDISFVTPSQSGFTPYDKFIDFLRRRAENCGLDVSNVEEATMQYTIREHGKDGLKNIAH